MTKQELIESIVKAKGMTKYEANNAVNAVFSTIREELSLGHKVALIGFGTFEVKERAARKGRNPQTGEAIEIAATKVVNFKPSKNLKEAVKEG